MGSSEPALEFCQIQGGWCLKHFLDLLPKTLICSDNKGVVQSSWSSLFNQASYLRMKIYGDGDDLLFDAPFDGSILLMVLIFMYVDATDATGDATDAV